MKLFRHSRLFGLAVVPVLVFGLFLALQSNTYNDDVQSPLPPNIVSPGDRGSESPAIIPSDRDMTKIEYRNIVFMDNGERTSGPAVTSRAASPELL